MAGFSEQAAQLPVDKITVKALEDIVLNASSFPASFAVQRGFSDASSILTDAADLDVPLTPSDFDPSQEAAKKTDDAPNSSQMPASSAAENGHMAFENSHAAVENGHEAVENGHTAVEKGGERSLLGKSQAGEGGNAGKAPQEVQTVVSAQLLQKLLDLKASGRLPNNLADDAASVLSVTAIDGSTCSGGELAATSALSEGFSFSGALSEISQPASNGHHPSPAASAAVLANGSITEDNSVAPASGVGINMLSGNERGIVGENANGEIAGAFEEGSVTPPEGNLEAKGSGISLTPESVLAQPFVPSGASSVSEESTRTNDKSPPPNSATKPSALNVNAQAFVPTFSTVPQSAGTGDLASNGFSHQHYHHQPLQFGSLPESLQPSPPYSTDGQQDWAGNGYTQEWQNGWEEEYYDPNMAYGEEPQYYQQEDGMWVAYAAEGYYDHTEGAHDWKASYGNGVAHEENGSSGRKGRGSRRGGEPSPWHSAAVDVLEQQFPLYSRDSLHEMLDLHEGRLPVALDMLAQLEAEMDGQLPSDGQDAPELNELNFPSLGSASSTPSKGPAKSGFAAAVKVKAPGSPSPQANGSETPSSRNESDAANGHAPQAPSSPDGTVPWRETGEAVTELYSNARAIARDHAIARNTFFQEATKAYLAGDKATAKQLGAKGREQSELMKAAHAEASQAIYKHRNPLSGATKGNGPRLVDLHGLHVKEAVAALEKEVAALRQHRPRNSRPVRLSVLVGTGHHTKGVRTPSRLPPAVEDWLRSERINFNRASPGLLEITI